MKKLLKIICIVIIAAISSMAFYGCNDNKTKGIDEPPEIWEAGIKPKDFDEPMPKLWEDEMYIVEITGCIEYIHNDMDIPVNGKKEITVSKQTDFSQIWRWTMMDELENIYVEEGHPYFVSVDGVLYSKSMQTLVKWPPQKPVTKPNDNIKYFAAECYADCKMPEDFEIPDETISIGRQAFYDSTLSKIHIKENVKTVGLLAFFSESLKTIEVSSPIVYKNFFTNRYVETIIFHEGVSQIRPVARNISILRNLKSVTFPDSLECIGDVQFPINLSVEEYEIKDSVKYLGKEAFTDHRGDISLERRKYKTNLKYSGEVATEYFDKYIEVWDKNWQDDLEFLAR